MPPDQNAQGTLVFEILADAYRLSAGPRELAVLQGGPSALLAGAGARLRDADIEAAIERAEDWLMPSSKSVQGFVLQVRDASGRLRRRLGAQPHFTPEEIERAFSAAVDDVAFGRAVDREAVADLVMVRELVHHGALTAIVLQ
jgi:hypothetical protein